MEKTCRYCKCFEVKIFHCHRWNTSIMPEKTCEEWAEIKEYFPEDDKELDALGLSDEEINKLWDKHCGGVNMGVSISKWGEMAVMVSTIIECKIKNQMLNKELGLPIEEISEEWIEETAKKLLMPPELIRNEIRITRKRLIEIGVENL
jgi:hypothetical protein